MVIFEAFCLTLVKKKIVRMESAGKEAATCKEKPSGDWLKKTNERASPSLIRLFFANHGSGFS